MQAAKMTPHVADTACKAQSHRDRNTTCTVEQYNACHELGVVCREGRTQKPADRIAGNHNLFFANFQYKVSQEIRPEVLAVSGRNFLAPPVPCEQPLAAIISVHCVVNVGAIHNVHLWEP